MLDCARCLVANDLRYSVDRTLIYTKSEREFDFIMFCMRGSGHTTFYLNGQCLLQEMFNKVCMAMQCE